MVKLVDTRDLKSLGPKPAMPVRFRLRAPKQKNALARVLSHMISDVRGDEPDAILT